MDSVSPATYTTALLSIISLLVVVNVLILLVQSFDCLTAGGGNTTGVAW